MTPETFGKYVVVEVIGRGGMADVYRARHPTLERDVAIKAIHPHLATEEGFRERFLHEARLVAGLRDPGIVAIHDFDVAEDRPYMVMELVGGGTLKDRIARTRAAGGRMTLDETASFLVPVADALDYAHARGAVHRDLKPANILLTTAGAPVLSDFGIAKILEDAVQLSATGALIGTPAYMSPEQAGGRPVDARTDQYSLGVVLYEMTTGHLPFTGESPTAVMVQHLQDPPPDPARFDPAMPAGVRAVILRALAKDPDARFASAGDMARAFVAGMGGEAEATLVAGGAAGEGAAGVVAAGAGAAAAEAGMDATVLAPGEAGIGATVVAGAGAGAGAVAASPGGATVIVPPAGPAAPAARSGAIPSAAPASASRLRRRLPLIAAGAAVAAVLAVGAIAVAGGWIGGGGTSPSSSPAASAPVAGAVPGGSGPPLASPVASPLVASPWDPPPPDASPVSSVVAPASSASAPPPSPVASAADSPVPPAPSAVPATPPPTPAAVVKPGKCPSSSDPVIYRADFAKAGAGWPVRSDGKVRLAYRDGAYRVTIIEPYHWWSAFYEPTGLPAKYAVGLRTWPAAGAGTGEYGIYFAGIDKNDTFELEIRDTGEYRVVKIAGGVQSDLVPWTATGRLTPGGANTLAVAVRGKVATICINGTAVTAVKDADLRAGRVGMVAESEAEKLDIAFDDFTLWTLR